MAPVVSILAKNAGQRTQWKFYEDILDPREGEEASDRAQVSHSISVLNDEQELETFITPEFVYHYADILTGLCRGDKRLLVDELLSIIQSWNFDFEIFWRHLTARKQCFQFVFE